MDVGHFQSNQRAVQREELINVHHSVESRAQLKHHPFRILDECMYLERVDSLLFLHLLLVHYWV